MAGTTAADRDFFAFYNFWIIPVLFWPETAQRLAETGQLKGDDSVHAPWLFDVAVDCLRRAKRFVNNAVGTEHGPVLRLRPVIGYLVIELQKKNGAMLAETITNIVFFFS